MIAHHQSSAAAQNSNTIRHDAVELIDSLLHHRTPTRDAIYHLLQECIKRKDLAAGRHAYRVMITFGLDSVAVLVDHLIRLFAECGYLLEADDIFFKASQVSIFTWNAIISAHANSGGHDKVLTLFHQMRHKGVQPDRITFLMVLKACRSIGNLGQLQLMHSHVNQQELESDVIVGSTLIDAYAKCGAVEEARRIFDRLTNRNIVSWGAMIAGYVQHGHCIPALLLYKKMELEGIEPNRVIFLSLLKSCSGITALREGRKIHDQVIRKVCPSDIEIGNALVDMYAKCGSLDEGQNVFVKLPARTIISWGTMIAGYTRQGHCDKAVQCFNAMRQRGSKPDHVIFTSMLTACSHEGLLEEGHNYFKSMIDDYAIAPNMEHYSCMIDLLGRVGRLNEAVSFLYSMPVLSDSILLTSLLTSCKTYHNVELGRFIFDILADLDPTNASLYVLMSNIYADAQMWDEVYHIQELMRSAGAWRKAAMAWIEVGNKVHEFTVGSESYGSNDNHSKLQFLSRFSIQKGHVPLLDLIWEPLAVSNDLV